MARPKAFDREQALEQAMELFWEQGYERTSVQQLCERLGIHKGSLYDTFGDKRELFLLCLDRFRSGLENRAYALLDEPGEPKAVLTRFFDRVVETSMDERKARRGCFIANTAMEAAPYDARISNRVEAGSADSEQIFYRFLQRASAAGQLDSSNDLLKLARFLVNTKQGLHVMAKTSTEPQALREVCEVALSVIR